MFRNKAVENWKLLTRFSQMSNVSKNKLNALFSTESVTIGNVTKEIKKAQKEEYVPRKYCK